MDYSNFCIFLFNWYNNNLLIFVLNKSVYNEIKMENNSIALREINLEQTDDVNTPEQKPEKIVYNQDTKQKIQTTLLLFLEFYRVLMGVFLIIFIPQKCGEEICSFSENLKNSDGIKYVSLYFNLITFISFFFLYAIEYRREHLLIDYLEVNKFKSTDNESVGVYLDELPIEKREQLWKKDYQYKCAGLVGIFIFIINIIVSVYSIYQDYLGSKTLTVLGTNFLFIAMKLVDVYNTVSTPRNVFLSAYMKKKIQFNDVDPDMKIK